MTDAHEQYIVHRYDRQPRQVSIKLEKNSRGYSWEVSYAADTVDEALKVIEDANEKLQQRFGQEPV